MNNQLKKLIEILLHLLFWVVLIYVFTHHSYIRPICKGEVYKEMLSVLLIAVMVYVNYWILIPEFLFKRKYALYIISAIFTVVFLSSMELWMVKSNILTSMSNFPKEGILAYMRFVYMMLSFRNLCFLLVFILVRLYKKSLSTIELERKINLLEKERFLLEKEYLKSRISPVYLLNVISSLHAGAINNEKQLPDKIGKLAILLNYYINQSNKETVSIHDEINFYEKYLEMELMKREAPIILSLIAEDIPQNIEIAPLIFEPIIANACKWVNRDNSAHIKFQFSYSYPNTLLFESENSISKEIDRGQCVENETIAQLIRRLDLLYPNQYLLERKTTKEYLTISLSIKNIVK